jgi:phosphoribosyl 1,2-cyclic phosphodiesterase
MSLFIASLNSGSNGNCYYVGHDNEAVLIDAGISCREIEKRMDRLGLPMNRLKAVFISHEHIDHIRGVRTLADKYELPVYQTPAILSSSPGILDRSHAYFFQSDMPVSIGELKITPFKKYHDAVDPFSFVVERQGVKVGIFTDIGTACKPLIHYFKQCHAAFLESNYDEDMLETGGYSAHLKRRIRGAKGHFSNEQALHLFVNHRPSFMSHLLLSHLSKNNNDPELVFSLFKKQPFDTMIFVASRYEASQLYHVIHPENHLNGKREVVPFVPLQLSLFG